MFEIVNPPEARIEPDRGGKPTNAGGALNDSATAWRGEVARVVSAGPSGLRLAIGDEEIDARAAVSCLVAPQAGDHVLVYRWPGGAHVLAVLDRPLAGPITLSTETDLVLEAPQVKLAGRDGVTIQTNSLRMIADRVSTVTRLLSTFAKRLRLSADVREDLAQDITQKFGSRTTHVDTTDVERMGTLSTTVDQTLNVGAGIAVVTAKGDLRFDGARVSVG
ncbi:DUF3540 domain-containing protein [Segnochrobactrum spirostomi]|uniref:DUF3540 domain-containing protein n=1 Tax=Segnochrobactrum spirostomi TaxID=2608987 RepID=UPI001AD7FCF1|nr:DUF3540 domain-containing protein [Segnochrobactrum spirostomi]